jgi:hypothetical protein
MVKTSKGHWKIVQLMMPQNIKADQKKIAGASAFYNTAKSSKIEYEIR